MTASPPSPGGLLVSPAWLIGGLRNVPGYLATDRTGLTFTNDEPVLDVALRQVTDVSWPWWWFGGGLKLTAAGQRWGITFVRPNGMPAPNPSMLATGVGVFALLGGAAGAVHDLQALRGLADIGTGRAAGRLWRQVLPASAQRTAERLEALVEELEEPVRALRPGLVRVGRVLDDPVVDTLPETLRRLSEDLLPITAGLRTAQSRVEAVTGLLWSRRGDDRG